MKKDQKGFSAVEGLLILVILGILGFVGWFVYHSQNETNKSYDNQSKASTAATTTDSYSGWKTGTLKYEKISFKYPSDWKLTDNSTVKSDTSGSSADNVSLTSPAGNMVHFGTGIVTGGAPVKTYDSISINSLGQSATLKIEAPSENLLVSGTPDLPISATLYMPSQTSKHITSVCNTTSRCATRNEFTYVNGPLDSSNRQKPQSVKDMESNQDFINAKKIFESMAYF